MQLQVNGDRRDVDDGTSIAVLLRTLVLSEQGIAVLVNGELTPLAVWPERRLVDGDVIEIVRVVGGG